MPEEIKVEVETPAPAPAIETPPVVVEAPAESAALMELVRGLRADVEKLEGIIATHAEKDEAIEQRISFALESLATLESRIYERFSELEGILRALEVEEEEEEETPEVPTEEVIEASGTPTAEEVAAIEEVPAASAKRRGFINSILG